MLITVSKTFLAECKKTEKTYLKQQAAKVHVCVNIIRRTLVDHALFVQQCSTDT